MGRLRTAGVMLSPFVALLVAGCASESELVRVKIKDSAFSPAEVTVEVGAAVRWTNQDPAIHSVTPTDPSQWGTAGSGGLPEDGVWSFTFTKPGWYDYFCEPHPFMTGVVIVGTQAPTTDGGNETSTT